MSSKKPTARGIKNSQHVLCLQTVLKLARWQVVAEIGFWGTWNLHDPEVKAFDWKYSSCIRLWNTTMKNWFHHFISFPLIYRFAGIRRVLTELQAENWKHRWNYLKSEEQWGSAKITGSHKKSVYILKLSSNLWEVFQTHSLALLWHWKTSFEKICFSVWASTLNVGLINKGWYGMFVACGIWCLADVSSVSPSSKQALLLSCPASTFSSMLDEAGRITTIWSGRCGLQSRPRPESSCFFSHVGCISF